MPPGRPLRRDALRNRALVLDAAIAVIAERGTGASTEDIAARAGVGVGTVFRHFPTKELLLEAVLERMFEELVARVRAALDQPDAGKALWDVLGFVIERSAAKKAVAEGLTGAGVDLRRRGWAGGFRDALAELLARAQRAKAVRRDIGITELMAVIVAASRAAEHVGEAHALREHTIRVILDGLQPR